MTLTEDHPSPRCHFPSEIIPGKARNLTRVLERESQCPNPLGLSCGSSQRVSLSVRLLTWPPSGLPDSHLCEHDEPDEERDDGHNKDEDLPPVLLTEHPGIHVHQRCHQAFYTHKLDERVRESGAKRAPTASPVSQLQPPPCQQPPSPAPKSSSLCMWV